MSSAYLLIGLFATFTAVGLFSYAFSASGGDRERAVSFLKRQVDRSSINLREEELNQSLLSRSLMPVLQRLGAVIKLVTPKGMTESTRQKIALAGLTDSTNAEQVIAFRFVGAAASFVLILLWSSSRGTAFGSTLLMSVFFAAIAYFAPDAILSGRADRRQDQIRKALPDTMDMLMISVEAGLGLDAAMGRVIQHVKGPLSDELNRVLQEMRLGMSRTEALKTLKERTKLEELDSFVVAIVKADSFGVSIANVLRAQAHELRTKRRQRAEEKAQKIPVKILFPLIFCVLPALFVVVIGPGVIQIAQSLVGGL